MFQELTEDSLEKHIQSGKTVYVQYAAGWCGNCRVMKPKFKKYSGEHLTADFLVVDAEKFPNSRKFADVSNLPTFAAFKEGKLVKQVQTNKADVLKEFIDEVASN